MTLDSGNLYEDALPKRAWMKKLALSIALAAPFQSADAQQASPPNFLAVANSREFREQFDVENDYFSVVVGGEHYRAYKLHNNSPDLSDSPRPEDFSITAPWLITDSSGTAIRDRALVNRAAFTANLTEKTAHGFARELASEQETYTTFLQQAAAPEAVLTAAQPAVSALTGLLLAEVPGAGLETIPEKSKKLTSVTVDFAKNLALNTITTGLKHVLSDNELNGLKSSTLFRDAMYDIVRESTAELKQLAGSLAGVHDFDKAQQMSRDITSAKTRRHAALAALQTYYSSDGARSAWNFLMDQVALPAAEGATGLDSGAFTATHSEALSSYFHDVAEAQKLFEAVYGPGSVEKGEELMLETLNAVCGEETGDILRNAGLGGFARDYLRFREQALRQGSSIADKMAYTSFLSDIARFIPHQGQADQRIVARYRQEFAPLPPDAFVREYDKAFQNALENPENSEKLWAFQTLLTEAMAPPVRRRPFIRYHSRQQSPVQGNEQLYQQALSLAESSLQTLEHSPLTPERRRRLEQSRNRLEQVKRYHTLLRAQPELQHSLYLMMQDMLNNMEK